MTRRFCQRLAVKLPDAHSCGTRCADFPGCLPPIPAEVLDTITSVRAMVEAERRTSLAVREFLELLRQALTEGIGKRNNQELPPAG